MPMYPKAQNWLLPQNTYGYAGQPETPGGAGSENIIPSMIMLHTNGSNSSLEFLRDFWARHPDGSSRANGNEANYDLEVSVAHGGKGRLGQFMDPTRRADSTGGANAFWRYGKRYGAVSIESGDRGQPYALSWTDLGQRKQLEDLCVWLCLTFKIPAMLARANSHGGWDGIGYHSQPPWHDQWNIHSHVCPGAGKIAEVPNLIAAVARRVNTPPPPPPPPPPSPPFDSITPLQAAAGGI